jgi:hypothetical protein
MSTINGRMTAKKQLKERLKFSMTPREVERELNEMMADCEVLNRTLSNLQYKAQDLKQTIWLKD